MTIIKLTKSGKGLQVILGEEAEPGTVLQIPAYNVIKLINGEYSGGFAVFSQLPVKTDPNRFPPSPLYDPLGVAADITKKTGDMFSSKNKKEKDKKKKLNDKKIDW